MYLIRLMNTKGAQHKLVCLPESIQKQHKTRFAEECLQFLDRRKQAKMQWLQDPHQSNVDNLNTVRREDSRHFRKKEREYLKAKINGLETNSNNKDISDLYRCISDFKKRYQSRNNVVKDQKGDVVANVKESESQFFGYRC
jgi:hypothetical protein